MSALPPLQVSVVAPNAHRVILATAGVATDLLLREGRWSGELDVPEGATYWLCVDGGEPLVDPSATQVQWTPDGPRSVRRAWPQGSPLGRRAAMPVIYELHVKGFGGSYRGCIERLGYLAELGVDVIELMPVQPFDTADSYWGYMPVVWGGVHDGFAEGDDPPAELAELIAAAHAHGLAVWLDVVFNHTGEGEAHTWTLRGLDPFRSYLWNDGVPNNDSGCGNTVDVTDSEVRRLVMEALQRFVAMGVDGFRFDLASILARNGGDFVEDIAAWAAAQGVEVVAEPWDLGRYMVGDPEWVLPWRQWNDRFREDIRALLRGDQGRIDDVVQRLTASQDLFGHGTAPQRTVNFVTAHDGLTLYDVFATDMPTHVAWAAPESLRPQLIKNAFTALLLAQGAAMFVMGDEFGRTQGGDPNPYRCDSPVSWVDWSRLDRFRDVHDFVAALIALRKASPPVGVRTYGVDGQTDEGWFSHTVAWTNGEWYAAINMWTEPLEFHFQEPGPWTLALCSATGGLQDGKVPARACAVWRRTAPA